MNFSECIYHLGGTFQGTRSHLFLGQFVGCLIECNTSLGQQNKHLKSVTFLVAFVGGKMFSIETPAAGWIPYNNPANFSSCPMDWVDLDRFF